MMGVYFTELPPTPENTHFSQHAILTIENCENDPADNLRLMDLGIEVGHAVFAQLRGGGLCLIDSTQTAQQIVDSLGGRIKSDEKAIKGKYAFLTGARGAILDELLADEALRDEKEHGERKGTKA